MFSARIVAALVVCIAFTSAAVAQSPTVAASDSLMQFFRPGTFMMAASTDPGLELRIYEKPLADIILDSRELDFEALSKKHPVVKEHIAKEVEELKEYLRKQPRYQREGAEVLEPTANIHIPRMVKLYTVSHVGSDYVLVEPASGDGGKVAIAKQVISQITWPSRLPIAVRETRPE